MGSVRQAEHTLLKTCTPPYLNTTYPVQLRFIPFSTRLQLRRSNLVSIPPVFTEYIYITEAKTPRSRSWCQVNSTVISSHLTTDATEGRLSAGNWEADATPAGVTPILHGWIRPVYKGTTHHMSISALQLYLTG